MVHAVGSGVLAASTPEGDCDSLISELLGLKEKLAELQDVRSSVTQNLRELSTAVKLKNSAWAKLRGQAARSSGSKCPDGSDGDESGSDGSDKIERKCTSDVIAKISTAHIKRISVLEAISRRPTERQQRHLVLNFDVNKTVIMSDRISGKTTKQVVNAELATVAWGMDVEGRWVLQYPELSTHRPTTKQSTALIGWTNPDDLITYADWLEKAYPKGENKKKRFNLSGSFTDEGKPGASFAEKAREFEAGLNRPDGTPNLLLPSFLHSLVSLKRTQRSFTIVFRTYGEDLEDIAADLNDFCEGRHPLFPGFKMDGSDGQPDYRVVVRSQDSWGTFHRDDTHSLSVVMGTTEQPGEGKYKNANDTSIDFYKEIPGVKIYKGYEAVKDYLWERTARAGTIALRDFYGYWKAKGMKSEGGKVFMFNPHRSSNVHSVFFDDNIRYDDLYIVQPINITDPERKYWVINLMRTHLVRAEPLQSMQDNEYFIKELTRLEDGYSKTLRAQDELRALVRQVELGAKKLHEIPLKHQEYDAWCHLRKSDSDISERGEVEFDDDDPKHRGGVAFYPRRGTHFIGESNDEDDCDDDSFTSYESD